MATYYVGALMDIEQECASEQTEAEYKICKQLAKWTKNNRENPLVRFYIYLLSD